VLWLKPIILATQKEEMRRSTAVQGQPRQKVLKTPFQTIARSSGVLLSS
jgi:hypothetical protein